MTFDMPDASAGWPSRGRWVIDHLSADLEITETQAAGIVGNLGFESAGFTELHEIDQPGGSGGYGWAQWTGPRREEFFSWCQDRGLEWTSDEANYGFLLVELRGAFSYIVHDLKEKSSVEDAVFLVGRLYEAPGGTTETHLPGYAERLQYARQALNSESALPPSADALVIPPCRDLQTALASAGFYKGRIDGDWGVQSQAALAMFYRTPR